jgi:hypothetical protein
MSEISPKDISKLLEKERGKAVILEQSLERIKEQLSLCKGAIFAYEQLLNGQSATNGHMESDKMSLLDDLVLISSKNGEEGSSDVSHTGKVTYKSKTKKKRAARATKAEMSLRKKVVAGVLKEKGDMTPKDLNPLVDSILGKPLESHHLRAVLRRFSDIFETKKEHGLWGLTEQGHRFCEEMSDDEEDTSEENSS